MDMGRLIYCIQINKKTIIIIIPAMHVITEIIGYTQLGSGPTVTGQSTVGIDV